MEQILQVRTSTDLFQLVKPAFNMLLVSHMALYIMPGQT
jgi:hypothetical protein